MSETASWQPSASIPNLLKRAAIMAEIRRFFADRGVLEVETRPMTIYTPSVPRPPPVAHQINMTMAHINAKSSVVFRPLKWPRTCNLPSIAHTLNSLSDSWLDMRLEHNEMIPEARDDTSTGKNKPPPTMSHGRRLDRCIRVALQVAQA